MTTEPKPWRRRAAAVSLDVPLLAAALRLERDDVEAVLDEEITTPEVMHPVRGLIASFEGFPPSVRFQQLVEMTLNPEHKPQPPLDWRISWDDEYVAQVRAWLDSDRKGPRP